MYKYRVPDYHLPFYIEDADVILADGVSKELLGPFTDVYEFLNYLSTIIENFPKKEETNVRNSVILRIEKAMRYGYIDRPELTNAILVDNGYNFRVKPIVDHGEVIKFNNESFRKYKNYLKSKGYATIDEPFYNCTSHKFNEEVEKAINKEIEAIKVMSNYDRIFILAGDTKIEDVTNLEKFNNNITIACEDKYSKPKSLAEIFYFIVKNVSCKYMQNKYINFDEFMEAYVYTGLIANDEFNIYNTLYSIVLDAYFRDLEARIEQEESTPAIPATDKQKKYIMDLCRKTNAHIRILDINKVSKIEAIHLVKYLLDNKNDPANLDVIKKYL